MHPSFRLIALGFLTSLCACEPANRLEEERLSCGANTVLQGTECVSVAGGLVCGAGTFEVAGSCVPNQAPLQCGPGTQAQNGSCVPLTGMEQLTCGIGTTAHDGRCDADLTGCSTGTMQSGTVCVASASTGSVFCGVGTARVGDECRVNLSAVCSTDTTGAGGTRCVGRVGCGLGTTRVGDVCTSSTSTVTCGAGTMVTNGRCEVVSSVCGPGTALVGGKCVVSNSSTPTTLQSFAALAAVNGAFDSENYPYMTGYRTRHRVVLTDLSQGNAEAWAAQEIPPVGQGAALHLKIDSTELYGTVAQTILIKSGLSSSGSCMTSLQPTSQPSPPSSGTYLTLFGWNAQTATPLTCATGGSLKMERTTVNGTPHVKLTFNAQFSDGTLWSDKVYVVRAL